MEVLDKIKECKSDEELKELIGHYIEERTKDAKDINIDINVIGYDIDINANKYQINESNKNIVSYYGFTNAWSGYIPKDMKITYGRSKSIYDNFSLRNSGWYYYVDDDSYIYEFFQYIKDLDLEYDYDIFLEINNFIERKFGNRINPKVREEIHKLFTEKDGYTYIRPIKEHSIKDFYGNGSAMCSEKALVAENLLSILGFEVIYVHDEKHAYNLLIKSWEDQEDVDENNNPKEKIEVYILDFSDSVPSFDINHEFIRFEPYYMQIEGADEEFLNRFISDYEPIELPDYINFVVGKETIVIPLARSRTYGEHKETKSEEKVFILERKKR